MFKSQQPLILFMTLLMTSCFTSTQKNVPSEETKPDVFLEHIDSVLSYADNEIENIVHTYEESEKEHDILVNEIKRLNKEISKRNNVIEEITTDYNDLTDSLITIIGIQEDIVTQKEYMITNLENKLHYLNSQMTEQVVQYESIVYRLEDSLFVLNSYIEELNTLQREGSLENKKRNRN
jgi:chromosome segregation ATPase